MTLKIHGFSYIRIPKRAFFRTIFQFLVDALERRGLNEIWWNMTEWDTVVDSADDDRGEREHLYNILRSSLDYLRV